MPDLVTWAWPLAGGVLSWLAESTVVAALLAALALLGGRVGRPRLGPATRHVLWLMVLIRLASPPVVHWPWSVPPLRQAPAIDLGPRPIAPERSGAGSIRREGPVGPLAARAPSTLRPDRGEADDRATGPAGPSLLQGVGTAIVAAWLVGSVVLASRQARQVLRFRRLLADAGPAPSWLVEEAEGVGRRMAVRVPEIRVVPRLETPLLWCLGRPVLLIPAGLIRALESDRWRAILAHELAHLRRRDHWVRRLELAAGLAWWWNPLYRLALRHLDHEAELACDAWALRASPGDRIAYAESLIRIGSAPTTAGLAVPSLGIAGAGPSFERRLTMILSERVDCRASLPGVLAALVLAALSLPSWTAAEAARADLEPAMPPTSSAAIVPTAGPAAPRSDDDDKPKVKADDVAGKEAEQAALERKMEALGREMERKFGPGSEFAKKMETLGEEIGRKFGADSGFAEKMEALGGEIAEKLGPGSAFAKVMVTSFGPDSDFAKELAKALGPDSELAKEMKKLGLDIQVTADPEAKIIPDDPAKPKAKAKAEIRTKIEVRKASPLTLKAKAKADEASRKAKEDAPKPKEKANATASAARAEIQAKRRDGRIEALQARIEAMQEELDKLKAESKSKDEDDQ